MTSALSSAVEHDVLSITSSSILQSLPERRSFVCAALDFQMTGIYMVGSCPSKYQDTDLEQQCLRTVAETNYTYLMDLPVTSHRSNLTYVNYYCALCHDDANNLHRWNVSIKCARFPKDVSMQQFLQKAKYRPGLRQWKSASQAFCLFTVEEFSRPNDFIGQFSGRQCVNPKPICSIDDKCQSLVRECSASWPSNRDREKCRQYAMTSLHGKISYKNPHCALCNGVNVSQLTCMPSKGHVRIHRLITLPQTFSTLMDFKSVNCSDQDLYDPVNRVCHKIRTEPKDCIRLLLYIKLGVIQGLTWTTGFLAAYTGLPACWYLFTVLNGLQGFLIFISFDLKEKVWLAVYEKLSGKVRSLRSASLTTFTSVASSSSRKFHSHSDACTETSRLDDVGLEHDKSTVMLNFSELQRVGSVIQTMESMSVERADHHAENDQKLSRQKLNDDEFSRNVIGVAPEARGSIVHYYAEKKSLQNKLTTDQEIHGSSNLSIKAPKKQSGQLESIQKNELIKAFDVRNSTRLMPEDKDSSFRRLPNDYRKTDVPGVVEFSTDPKIQFRSEHNDDETNLKSSNEV
ncbi:hypothetical protein HAZT_HAZT009260 [Hyalella azteca]|uniref:Uncharacterized protein n=1 Tax=Hyalella azteca TaxID=294128 RepID=A0A6A0GTC8_HYAAZ|nr:hypothetical protein HAZT_HAZT009260 [Hyalella azteca]